MRIFKVNRKNFNRAVMIATEAIKKGKVIVCPTDTVYGLIADATNRDAVQRAFRIKKRPKKNALPIFVKDLKMARRLAKISKTQEKILKEIWPGKVTAILEKKEKTPKQSLRDATGQVKIFGAAPKTIGLRIPKYELVNALLAKLNRPLVGTSANISGKPASTKIKEVIAQFENQKFKPDLIIDAKNLKPSKPSTVINLTGKKIKIIRK